MKYMSTCIYYLFGSKLSGTNDITVYVARVWYCVRCRLG